MIALALGVPAFVSGQQLRERVIQRVSVEKDEPLTITDVRVNSKSISLGRKFGAVDDWMRSLVISVKNKSERKILFASLRLSFPRPAGSKDPLSIYDVSHGNDQLMTRQPTPSERLVGIMPGSTVELGLSVQDLVSLQDFLTGTGYPSGVEKVDLSIGHVIFDDDTMWYAGTLLRRDPNNSATWINSSR